MSGRTTGGTSPTGARALVYDGPDRVAVRDFPLPLIGPDDLLVEVALAGVDGSDVHMLRGEIPRINALAPVILGDEIVGTVAEIGARAATRRGLTCGDRVIVEARWPCDRCPPCRAGQYYLCDRAGQGEGGHGYGWISCDETPHLWGGYASHVFVPGAALVHPVPPGMGAETALVCGSVLANAHRWTAKAHVGPGDTVVVVGPGPQGIACALAASHRGAEVAVVGLMEDADRIGSARALGIANVVTTTPDTEVSDAVSAVRSALEGPIDVVIDAAGGGSSKALALALVRPMGTIANVSVPSPACAAIDWLEVLLKEVTLISPLSHPHAVRPALRMGSELLARGLDAGRLVSHVFSLEDAERPLRTAAYEFDERPTKVAIRPGGTPW